MKFGNRRKRAINIVHSTIRPKSRSWSKNCQIASSIRLKDDRKCWPICNIWAIEPNKNSFVFFNIILQIPCKNNLIWNCTKCLVVWILLLGSEHSCLTCSVDASRGHGASKGRDLSCFLCPQLCNRFLFYRGRGGGCFRERGREHVLAFLDTSENTEDKCENTEDIHRLLREKHTSRLWSLALWEISAGQWVHSKYKLVDHKGDYTEQTAITNQLLVILKDKFIFK